jgi:hypothetical protein
MGKRRLSLWIELLRTTPDVVQQRVLPNLPNFENVECSAICHHVGQFIKTGEEKFDPYCTSQLPALRAIEDSSSVQLLLGQRETSVKNQCELPQKQASSFECPDTYKRM